MSELNIDFDVFFKENKKLVSVEKNVYKLYEALDCSQKDPIRDDFHTALISLRRVLWLKFVIYASKRGIFSPDAEQTKKNGVMLYEKFKVFFPPQTPCFCKPEYRKALKRRQRKQGDQGE